MKKVAIAVLVVILAGYAVYRIVNSSSINPNPKYTYGQAIDSLNGVKVYYNGMVGHCGGRDTTSDGYNIGIRYQCVAFIKRYYYQRLHHKMPDSYGNAKEYFDRSLPDSGFNAKRGLTQFTNGSKTKPAAEDLLVYDGHSGNKYGHVAIVSWVSDTSIGIIQQNPGPFASSRDTFRLKMIDGRWFINKERVLGWLRKDTARTMKE